MKSIEERRFKKSNIRILVKMSLAVICFMLLLTGIGVVSATIIGTPPNPTGDTIIDQDTVWDGESDIHCGGGIIVGNATQRIDFDITNSHVTVKGKWTMAGDTPVNFTLLDSTIFFDVTSGETASQPPGALFNRNQIIVVESTSEQSKASRIELRNSIIKGTDYSHLAGGMTIKSGAYGNAKHTLIVDTVTFASVGGAIFGVGETWALNTMYWGPSELASDSSLTNITLDYCGRGIKLCNNIGVDYATAKGGYVAFFAGEDWNHLTMHKTTEGLYNPADGAWIRNSWFDAGKTKFNIMSASDVTFEYNTVVLASCQAGSGSYLEEGNNNILQHNTFIQSGVAGVKTGLKLIDNTFDRGQPSGGDIPIYYGGQECLILDNTITGGATAIRIIPQPDWFWDRTGGHVIKNNIIDDSHAGIYLERQDGMSVINNAITDVSLQHSFDGYGIKIVDCTSLLFRDNSITNTDRFDIAFGGWERDLYGGDLGPSSNVKFINTKFDENKVHFVNTEDVFNNYYYLDVKVVDSNGNPIQGATVTITNDVDRGYPAINANGEPKTSFITGADGHTPQPSDLANSAAILDYWENSATKTQMSYTITAEYDGHSDSTTVTLDSSWYRSDPNIHQNTVAFVLNTGPDTTPPTITSHSPFGIDVAVNTNISVDFSEAMNQSSAQNAFSISPNVAGSFSWAGNQMTFNSSSDLSNETTYTITISALAEDIAGNNLQSPYTWNFTTIAEIPPDTTSPIRSNGSPSGILSYGTTQTTLSLTTDENSTCKYSTSAGVAYASMLNTFSTTGTTSHSTTVSGLSDGNTYTYYVRCIDTSNNANTNDYLISFSIDTEPETNGLVGHWKFDENTGDIAYDSSGNSNNGTLTNMDSATDWVEGKIGNALQFDGTDDYVDFGSDASLAFTDSDPWTFEHWIKWTGQPSDSYVFFAGKSSASECFTIKYADSQFGYRDKTAAYHSFGANSADDCVNVWSHIVWMADGDGNLSLYINGAYFNTITTPTQLHFETLGRSWSHNTFMYEGAIDEVKIYNRALSAEEIRVDYEAGLEDTIPPASISNLQNSTGTTWINWTWINPLDTDFSHTKVYLGGIGQISTSNIYFNATNLTPDTSYEIGTHTVDTTGNMNSTWVNQTAKTLALNNPPVADPNGPYTGTEGVPIHFNGSGSYDPDGSIVAYEWDLGDGNNATGVTPTHTYTQNGTYNVTLTVTDDEGATDTNTTTATIADTEPIADFIATPTSGQEPLTVTFTDNSTSHDGLVAWEWDFDNDGVTDSTEQNPTHVYVEEGMYTVSLTVTGSDGDSDTITKEDYITVTGVNNAPYTPANPSPSDGAMDVPVDADLSWTGGDPDAGDIVTYDVYFGTNISPLLVAEDQSGTTYDPGRLDYSTEYYWQIVAKDDHGASNESGVWSFTTTASPGTDLVGLWHFDEGTGVIAADSSEYGNDGILVNGPIWVNGKLGKALSFDGVADYVDFGHDASLAFTDSDPWTFEHWIKWTGQPSDSYVFFAGKSSADECFTIKWNNNNQFGYRDKIYGTYHSFGANSADGCVNVWSHIAWTADGDGNLALYINGAYFNTITTPTQLHFETLGRSWGFNVYMYEGAIDEVKIYNRALSAEEIRVDYEAGLEDTIPPASISNLQNTSSTTWINWTWINPLDTDFSHTKVYLDGIGQKNTSNMYFNATGLIADTSYEIGTRTVDTYGNVNSTWVNQTAKTLALNSPPVADPNNPYTGMEGVPIHFKENGSYDPDGFIVAYLWAFGDGNNATEVNPTHIYTQNGTYTLALTVTDNEGATNMSTTTATIADTEPTADFIATPTSGQEPLTVNFTDNATSYDGIIAWNWDFNNDGVTDSTVQNPTHVYAEEGVYTVSLTVNESDGDSDIMTKTDYITVIKVNNPPVADPNGPYTGMEVVPILFNGSGSYDPDGSIVSYLWTFGDGNNATGATPTHTYTQNGTYTITLTVTDNDGATNTNTTTATIADTELTADFSASPISGQEPLTVNFTDNSASHDGIVTWDWDFDNDSVTDSTEQNPTHVYAEDGVYTVSLKVNESDGDCDTITKADYITVTEVNNAPYTPANPSPSDGAMDAPVDADLSWTGGDPDASDTVTYDVYFGTNISPLLVAEDQSGTTYDPGRLDYSTEYYWRIVATDNHGTSNGSGVWCFTTKASPGTDFIGLWHFDEGTGEIAADSSGNGNDGTLVNDPIWVDGKLGKALSFDGAVDYVDCGHDASLDITDEITIMVWVKPNVAGEGGPNAGPVCKAEAGVDWSWQLRYNAPDGGNYMGFQFNGVPEGSTWVSVKQVLSPGDWYHIAGTFDGTTIKCFLNGIDKDTNQISAIKSGASTFFIGQDGWNNIFNGIVDEVKIYNWALGAEEIRADYEARSSNHPPTAFIDSITPDPAEQGKDTISFTGHGTDTDGSIAAYHWSSSFDGQLSTATSFSKPASELSVGTHTIYFKVQDDEGAWSTEITENLTIIEPAN